MTSDDLLPSLDLLLRGGSCMLLLLVAGLLLRDHRRSPAAQLGALFAAGGAAYAICSTPGLHAALGWRAAPIMALAAGNNLVFWLFARTLFDDGFRPRPWHAALWAAIVAAALLRLFVLPPDSAVSRSTAGLLAFQAIGFAALAALQTLASWGADLVDARRRLRVFVVVAAIGHTLASAGASLLRGGGEASVPVALAEMLGFALIAGATAWSLLQVGGGGALFASPPAQADAARAPAQPVLLDRGERALAAALEHAMRFDRAYRLESLTIGRLAQALDTSEHRLRRLINRGLGWRNFNAFVNSYRLAEARAALADPAQVATPILTIALDAGFASLGPFNRAFRADTGQTPTAFRRAALAGSGQNRTASLG